MQPPSFKGEGTEVERDVEAWIEAMDDYFSEAGTTPANQAMLSTFRLTGDAKLWWKQHCKDCGVLPNSQSCQTGSKREILTSDTRIHQNERVLQLALGFFIPGIVFLKVCDTKSICASFVNRATDSSVLPRTK